MKAKAKAKYKTVKRKVKNLFSPKQKSGYGSPSEVASPAVQRLKLRQDLAHRDVIIPSLDNWQLANILDQISGEQVAQISAPQLRSLTGPQLRIAASKAEGENLGSVLSKISNAQLEDIVPCIQPQATLRALPSLSPRRAKRVRQLANLEEVRELFPSQGAPPGSAQGGAAAGGAPPVGLPEVSTPPRAVTRGLELGPGSSPEELLQDLPSPEYARTGLSSVYDPERQREGFTP
eukprot:CAMPEP_0182855846 /NCGR_PEP_ID=MMETSP0034_2-20130328/2092_1 /TAXON_ID=156128 /ORGANISM="Nephroselmis pyriformis, Strain CCMP717" /LENGTH=233 /DNA_ID=CAMNT_0024986867 /DNA_START=215 /DNA_END=912 /DNA_ORIENTATION=+